MRFVSITITFLMLVSFQAGALSARDLIFTPAQPVASVANLTVEQMDEDLNYLRLAVRNAYAGPRTFVYRIDYLSASKVKGTDSTAFCSALAPLFSGIADRHLRAYLNFQPCASASNLPMVGQVGQNLTPDNQFWALQTRTTNGKSISVLSISRFAPQDDPGWQGFLQAVTDLRAQNQPFVLDLRGNPGGDDGNGIEMAHILYGNTLPLPLDSMLFVQTAESYAIQLSYWNYKYARATSQNQELPEGTDAQITQLASCFTKAESGKYPSTYDEKIPLVPVDLNQAFAPEFYVLIDRMCASACETTLQALEALPNRILVGENTYGAVEYGDIGLVVLPNSHVAVQLATTWNRFRDGRRPEGIGYAPKVKVTAGGDALQTALGLIAK